MRSKTYKETCYLLLKGLEIHSHISEYFELFDSCASAMKVMPKIRLSCSSGNVVCLKNVKAIILLNIVDTLHLIYLA